MPHGTEIGLDRGHIVLDGDPAIPSPQRGGGIAANNFRPTSIVTKQLDGSGYHLVQR